MPPAAAICGVEILDDGEVFRPADLCKCLLQIAVRDAVVECGDRALLHRDLLLEERRDLIRDGLDLRGDRVGGGLLRDRGGLQQPFVFFRYSVVCLGDLRDRAYRRRRARFAAAATAL